MISSIDYQFIYLLKEKQDVDLNNTKTSGVIKDNNSLNNNNSLMEEAVLDEIAQDIQKQELQSQEKGSSIGGGATSSSASTEVQRSVNLQQRYPSAGLTIQASKYELLKQQAALVDTYKKRLENSERESSTLRKYLLKAREEGIPPRKSEAQQIAEKEEIANNNKK